MHDAKTVSSFVDSLATRQTIHETLDFIAEWCSTIARARFATILLFAGSPTESIRSIERSSPHSEGDIDHAVNVMAGGWVKSNAKPLLTDDALLTLGFEDPTDRQRRIGSLISAPLRADDAMPGILNLARARGESPFSAGDLDAVMQFAPLAARFIDRARHLERISLDHARLRSASPDNQDMHWIPSLAPVMQEITHKISRVAHTSATVLITGESGTGKDLIAWAIHLQSLRSSKSLIAVNCGGIPPTLADAEFFGHEKGAFTGADTARSGWFEAADGGTLFLDEISAMPLDLQPRLLRVLEDGKITRIGSLRGIHVDVRIIAASNEDLAGLVHAKLFREDLYHRLNVVPIHVPPLRERREDIPVMAFRFLSEFSENRMTFARDAIDLLTSMPWPGNVRELRNVVERVSILSPSNTITRKELSFALEHKSPQTIPDAAAFFRRMLQDSHGTVGILEEAEKQIICAALQEAGGNVAQAARLLGMGRVSLHRRVRRHGLTSAE